MGGFLKVLSVELREKPWKSRQYSGHRSFFLMKFGKPIYGNAGGCVMNPFVMRGFEVSWQAFWQEEDVTSEQLSHNSHPPYEISSTTTAFRVHDLLMNTKRRFND